MKITISLLFLTFLLCICQFSSKHVKGAQDPGNESIVKIEPSGLGDGEKAEQEHMSDLNSTQPDLFIQEQLSESQDEVNLSNMQPEPFIQEQPNESQDEPSLSNMQPEPFSKTMLEQQGILQSEEQEESSLSSTQPEPLTQEQPNELEVGVQAEQEPFVRTIPEQQGGLQSEEKEEPILSNMQPEPSIQEQPNELQEESILSNMQPEPFIQEQPNESQDEPSLSNMQPEPFIQEQPNKLEVDVQVEEPFVFLGIQFQQMQEVSRTESVGCDLYRIVAGDNCFDIWTRYGISQNEFFSLNPNVNCQFLQIGSTLCLPHLESTDSQCKSFYTVLHGDTCYSIWNYFGLTRDQFYSLNARVQCENLQPFSRLCVQRK